MSAKRELIDLELVRILGTIRISNGFKTDIKFTTRDGYGLFQIPEDNLPAIQVLSEFAPERPVFINFGAMRNKYQKTIYGYVRGHGSGVFDTNNRRWQSPTLVNNLAADITQCIHAYPRLNELCNDIQIVAQSQGDSLDNDLGLVIFKVEIDYTDNVANL